jgi:predicted transcriptional regulator
LLAASVSAHRLELLELLAQTERSVEELAGLSGLTIANTSQHPQQLRRFRLVEARRDGKA